MLACWYGLRGLTLTGPILCQRKLRGGAAGRSLEERAKCYAATCTPGVSPSILVHYNEGHFSAALEAHMKGKLNVCIALAFLIQVGALQLPGQSPTTDPSNSPSAVAVSAQSRNSGKSVGFQERYPRYQVLDGDTMDLVFEFSPEFNQTVTVQPDGYVSLRGIGDVHVASQTLPELVTTLQTAYGKILNKPSISVLLKNFKGPYFTAQGQVAKSGEYPLHGETTLAEGIAMAGGFTDNAKHSHVVLFRRVSSQWTEAKVIDVKKMMKEGNLSEDYVLRPGDMIFVPKNTLSKISRFIPTSSLSTYVNPAGF